MTYPIEVIGLGAGTLEQLPLGIYRKLKAITETVCVRTLEHPVITALQEEGVVFHSYDETYESHDDFADVYEHIVNDLVERAKLRRIVYAVPGHPMLAEKTVQLLLEREDAVVELAGGHSYLDALFTALRIDPIEGFQFVDGNSFVRSELMYRQHLVFCQVYDAFIASEVKLTLLEDLPADYQVAIVTAVGTAEEAVRWVALEELDHDITVDNLRSVYVPPAPKNMQNHTFARLKEIIAELRGPNGCPWDKKQTHESLREYAIEEVYELLEAIDQEDDDGIIEELGDVLLQVMLHSQIGEDNGYFTIDDVIRSIVEKMIHRHPHVFSNGTADSADEVIQHWDRLKQEEKGDARRSVLSGVPKPLPALAKAYKLQAKAAKVGFNWEDPTDIWAKLDEEINEVKAAIHQGNQTEIEEELGDVLFVLANLARFYQIHPEVALETANRKFIHRFTYIENTLASQGKALKDTTLEEMDYYWDQAKERE